MVVKQIALLCFLIALGSCLAQPSVQSNFRDWADNIADEIIEEKEAGCKAQPADAFVDDVFITGNTFCWTDLAGVDVYPKSVPSTNPLRNEVSSDSGRRTPPAPSSPNTPTAKTQSAVAPADVTDPYLLRPVSHKASGEGFPGTYDVTARPSHEALVVAPHPTIKGLNYVVHAIKAKLAIFIATHAGDYIGVATPGAVPFSTLLEQAGLNPSKYTVSQPVGFFDFEANKYVFVMRSLLLPSSDPEPTSPGSHFLVLVSATNDPTGDWIVKVIEAQAPQSTDLYCADANHFEPAYPQISYDTSALYLGAGTFCGSNYDWLGSSLWAYPKCDLYAPGNGTIKAAIYTTAGAFTASAKHNVSWYIQPAKPQLPSDVHGNPLFALFEGPSYIVAATMFDTEKIESMKSAAEAPRLKAKVVPFGFKFPHYVESNLSQYQSETVLDDGDPDFAVTGATKRGDTLYIANVKLYGASPDYVPSIYYAFLCLGPKDDFCELTKKAEGVLAAKQKDGRLGLTLPQIVGLPDGGALLMYAFSGNGELPGELGPMYAGVATTTVSPEGEAGIIDVVKPGDGVISPCGDNWCWWGSYSAFSVVEDRVWFAVARATKVAHSSIWYGSWISSQPLAKLEY